MRTSRSVVLVATTLMVLVGCSAEGGRPRSGVADHPASTSATEPAVEVLPLREMTRTLDTFFGGRTPLHPTVMSVLVSLGGDLVVERYYARGAARPHNIASVTKSVVGTLVGTAVDRGELSLDDSLAELLPAYASVMSDDESRVTLEQLLTMTAGFPGDPAANQVSFDPAAPDWVREILQAGQAGPTGRFAYSSATSHLLGAVLVEATGRSLQQLADERLFGPLGIDTRGMTHPVFAPRNRAAYDRAPLAWPVDPHGLNLGFGLLKLRPRDLVRLGLLYLHRGRWGAHQVVSESWVRQATTDHLRIREPSGLGYGFQWWVGDLGGAPAAVALGLGGQLVVVVPSLDLVVVATSAIKDPAVLDPTDLLDLLGDALVTRP